MVIMAYTWQNCSIEVGMPYKMVSWISGMSIPYKGIIFQRQPHSQSFLGRYENEEVLRMRLPTVIVTV